MRTRNPILLAGVVLALFAGIASTATAETLTGSFVWNNENQTGNLEATFTPTGEGTWDVAFNFTWEDKPHTWTGTAEGSLTEGDLKGEVVTDGERQATFVFEGTFENGSFSGTHAQLRGGDRRDTGTLKLSH